MRFNAPWGRLLKWSSLIATVVIAGIPVALMFSIPHAPRSTFLGLQATLLLVLLGSIPFVVRGYLVTDDAILVQRLLWNTRLPRATLTTATLEPNLRKGTVKTCGNGGLFSFTGWFYNKRIGHFRAFVNDWSHVVVLRFSNRMTCVVSPDDPEAFIAALGQQ